MIVMSPSNGTSQCKGGGVSQPWQEKKKERKKEKHNNRKKRTDQRGKIYHYVDHDGEWRDKLAKEEIEPTTWHDI